MNEAEIERRQPPAASPQGGEVREWEGVVRRISDRIRGQMGPQSGPTTQQSIDLASELVRLERRALEAEAILLRERDQYSTRVKEMEEKLRKLEPWLRRLRTEYQEASAERDRFRDEVARLGRDGAAPSKEQQHEIDALRTEREAALRESEAAKAARDAALAEAGTLRQRLDNDLRTLQESWRQRIETAEQSRDKALDELKSLRQAMNHNRRADEEVKRLLKQVEQLETTTAAHKAVARAAQEEAESLKQRLADAEKAAQRTSDETRGEAQRAQDAVAKLTAALESAEKAGAELAAAQVRLADLDGLAKSLREENDRVRTELAERERALGGAHGEAETLRKALEKVRAEVTDARKSAEAARADAARIRHELELAQRDAARDHGERDAEMKRREEELAAARKDAAEQRALAEEAARTDEKTRRAMQELVERMSSDQRTQEDAHRRAVDAEQRADQMSQELADMRRTADELRAGVAAGDRERQNILRSLEEERFSAGKRFEAAEASWRSQMRAAEGRFEAEISRERQRIAELERTADALQSDAARFQADAVAREEELARTRAGIGELVRMRLQEAADSIVRFVAGTSLDAMSITAEQELSAIIDEVPPTMEIGPPMALPGEPAPPDHAAAASTAASAPEQPAAPPASSASPSAPAPAPAASAAPALTAPASDPSTDPTMEVGGNPADWDRLLSDVEALRSQVEGLRAPDESDDTASVPGETASQPAAAPVSEKVSTSSVEVEEVVAPENQRTDTVDPPFEDTKKTRGRRGRR